MPINPNEELIPETSQEAFTARTYDPMQPVPEEAETNMEAYIKYLYDKTQRLPEKPDTREEYFMMIAGQNIGPGSDVEPLTVTENGTYSEAGKAYSPVTVEVPLPSNANERKSVTSYPVTDSAIYPLPKCDVTVTDADKCEVIVTTDNTITEDSGVYLERQSGGGNRELDAIVGGSVVWNQLVQNGNFADDSLWTKQNITLSVSDNVATVTYTGGGTYTGYLRNSCGGVTSIIGHKYFSLYEAKLVSGSVNTRARVGASDGRTVALTSSWQTISSVVSATGKYAEWNVTVVTTSEQNSVFEVRNCICIDLTATFGSTIADYIYSLEQSTAGSGIAWLKSYGYLTEDYYGYTANKIESVSVARHIMKDSNDSVIGIYPINPITLRGVPKLNASNQLYYDGDRYEASGRVTRKYKEVTLIDSDISIINEYNNLVYGVIAVRIDGLRDYFKDAILLKYGACHPHPAGAGWDSSNYIGEFFNDATKGDYRIGYPVGTTLDTIKSDLVGQTFVYELATPTTESTSPFEANQIVDANGTEEYIDAGVEAGTRDVAIPVGHETKYFNGKAYVKPLTAGTSDTVSMADMGIMPTSPMYIEANGTLDVEYWKSNS